MKSHSAALLAWLLLLLAALAAIWNQSWGWIAAADAVDRDFHRSGEVATTTRPGGIFLENDSYYWLRYAERIGKGETLRVRETTADNAPYGREVHWSQSVSWMLVCLGKLRAIFSGETWPVALEKASVILNPLLLSLFVCAMGYALLRRVGAVPAGLFLLYFVTQPDVAWAFNPLRPDHQTLHCILGIATLVGIIFGGAGWLKSEDENKPDDKLALIQPISIPHETEARFWFVLSGIAVGLGLWVSATVQSMLLFALFGAVAFLAIFAPRLKENAGIAVRPELWRLWGWTAGGVSLLFYFIEYFPSHLRPRLEVNSPVYSIMVVTMGEAACHFLRARYSSKWRPSLLKALGCSALAALVPLLILLGPSQWHAMRDAEMLRLHNFIQEFYAFPRLAGDAYVSKYFSLYGLLPIFLLAAILIAGSKRLPLNEWAVVWLSFALAYATLGLAYMQTRWLGVYAAMNIWLAMVVGVCAWSWLLRPRAPASSRAAIGWAITMLLLAQPLYFTARESRTTAGMIQKKMAIPEMITPVINKHLALELARMTGPGARIMADPSLAPALQYFAKASGVASFYWENTAGLHSEIAFLCDEGDSVARKICEERSIDYIILPKSDRLASYASYISLGRFDPAAVERTFALRIPNTELNLPDWLISNPTLNRLGSESYVCFGKPLQQQIRIFETRLAPAPARN